MARGLQKPLFSFLQLGYQGMKVRSFSAAGAFSHRAISSDPFLIILKLWEVLNIYCNGAHFIQHLEILKKIIQLIFNSTGKFESLAMLDLPCSISPNAFCSHSWFLFMALVIWPHVLAWKLCSTSWHGPLI